MLLNPDQIFERIHNAISQGVSPNACMNEVFDPQKELRMLAFHSVLSAMVSLGHIDIVKWLLDNGATTDIRPNQLCNLIALAINSGESTWCDDHPLPSGQATGPTHAYVQHRLISLIKVLANHGVGCDPENLNKQAHVRLELQSKGHTIYVQFFETDPFAALAECNDQQPKKLEDLGLVLLDLGACPANTLAQWRRMDVLLANHSGVRHAVALLEKCQAMKDARDEQRLLQRAVESANFRLPHPKKM